MSTASEMPIADVLSPVDAPLGGAEGLVPTKSSNASEGNYSPFPTDSVPPQGIPPCSYNECTSGHKWPAQLAVSPCPGCKGQMLAILKVNCPFCNEPTVRTILRNDFVPKGAGVAARCQGQAPMGESLDIELQRNQWQEVEGSTKSFLETVAEEKLKLSSK